MLTVCLHKLCAKDSLANAVRKVEKCVNIAPRGVENRPREGPKWAPGGLRTALGRQVGPIWPQGRSEAEFGRLLGALGALLGPPGAWGPFWPPGGHFLVPFHPLFGEPLRNCENLEIRRQYSTF